MLVLILFRLASLSTVLACAEHNNYELGGLRKRATEVQDWAYDSSYNWGMINENYTLCQIGTMQSPIMLDPSHGLNSLYTTEFNYPDSVEGNFFNWGYGPAFTVAHEEGNYTSNPSFTFNNETVYLSGWHLHAPADHSIQGDRTKAELHLVHVDAEGHERAVVAILIDPGNLQSNFFAQLPDSPDFLDTETQIPISLNPKTAISEANNFGEFWTYRGSLTSPPCTEGIRWFVARSVLYTDVKQMQDILRASTYSARVEQEVWEHQINA